MIVVVSSRGAVLRLAPVIKAIRQAELFEVVIVMMTTHADLVEDALRSVSLEADIAIAITETDPTELASRKLTQLNHIIENENPDVLLVQGAKQPSFLASLAAHYHDFPVVSMEAASNRKSGFNRRLINQIADLILVRDESQKAELSRQEVAGEITAIGNLSPVAFGQLGVEQPTVEPHQVLLTLHRSNLAGQGMRQILRTVRNVFEAYPEYQIVLPSADDYLMRISAQEIFADNPNVTILNPQPVLAFHELLLASKLVITDSLGVEEEAKTAGKPVLFVSTDPQIESPELFRCLTDLVEKPEQFVTTMPTSEHVVDNAVNAIVELVSSDAPEE